MTTTATLLDLVSAVSAYARSDAEVVATVVYLVNSGAVRLIGNFRGARFDLDDLDDLEDRPAGGRGTDRLAVSLDERGLAIAAAKDQPPRPRPSSDLQRAHGCATHASYG